MTDDDLQRLQTIAVRVLDDEDADGLDAADLASGAKLLIAEVLRLRAAVHDCPNCGESCRQCKCWRDETNWNLDEIVKLRSALSSLYDAQNGPPLLAPRHLKHWNDAMAESAAALGRAKP